MEEVKMTRTDKDMVNKLLEAIAQLIEAKGMTAEEAAKTV